MIDKREDIVKRMFRGFEAEFATGLSLSLLNEVVLDRFIFCLTEPNTQS